MGGLFSRTYLSNITKETQSNQWWTLMQTKTLLQKSFILSCCIFDAEIDVCDKAFFQPYLFCLKSWLMRLLEMTAYCDAFVHKIKFKISVWTWNFGRRIISFSSVYKHLCFSTGWSPIPAQFWAAGTCFGSSEPFLKYSMGTTQHSM